MSVYDYTVKTRKGEDFELKTLKGKVILVVNTATGCGFTPQYEGLEKLYEQYHEKGLEILDFPCNQFANQAPGTNDEIHEFCTFKYKTQFDQLAKIEVNGEGEAPLYSYLKSALPTAEESGFADRMKMKAIAKISKTAKNPGDIQWNFTKFLIGRDGIPAKRYDPTCKPEDIEKDIKTLLGE